MGHLGRSDHQHIIKVIEVNCISMQLVQYPQECLAVISDPKRHLSEHIWAQVIDDICRPFLDNMSDTVGSLSALTILPGYMVNSVPYFVPSASDSTGESEREACWAATTLPMAAHSLPIPCQWQPVPCQCSQYPANGSPFPVNTLPMAAPCAVWPAVPRADPVTLFLAAPPQAV